MIIKVPANLNKNPMSHSRSKHIGIGYHWIREPLHKKKLNMEKSLTKSNWSDMMSKTITDKIL